MRGSTLDEMTDHAVAVLATGDRGKINSLVRDLAMNWPNEPALAISFAISSAASELKVDVTHSSKTAGLAFRLAALAAADIFAIEQTMDGTAYASHLLQFWRRVDPFFLEI